MSQTSTLPVPRRSRPRSVSRSSIHSNPDGSQEHPIATPQEPLLLQTDTSHQVTQPSYVQSDVLVHESQAERH